MRTGSNRKEKDSKVPEFYLLILDFGIFSFVHFGFRKNQADRYILFGVDELYPSSYCSVGTVKYIRTYGIVPLSVRYSQ